MIEPNWPRIAGLHVQEDGTVGIVWLALEPGPEIIHVYDCCLWNRPDDTFPIIADGIANRGRWIPVAWNNEPYAEKLLNDWGINTLPEAVEKDPAVATVETREVLQRMRAKQFAAKRSLRQWKEEFQTFIKEAGKVPLDTHPLMSATWYAVSHLQWAKAEKAARSAKRTYPKLATVV